MSIIRRLGPLLALLAGTTLACGETAPSLQQVADPSVVIDARNETLAAESFGFSVGGTSVSGAELSGDGGFDLLGPLGDFGGLDSVGAWRFVDGVLYLKDPNCGEARWLYGPQVTPSDGSLSALWSDPVLMLDLIGGVVNGSVREASTTVPGEQVFDVEISIDKATDSMPPERTALLATLRHEFGDAPLDGHVHVDDAGRLTQIAIDLPGVPSSVLSHYEMSFSDFGRSVTVDAPPPNELLAPADDANC